MDFCHLGHTEIVEILQNAGGVISGDGENRP